ncbi:MAG TPA: hypothetical protein ENI17_02695 [Pseudomonas xinjiangensis]|uniref:Uncharacterized protein n=2 Tax=root TaxID=1 RepID=A0A7V1BSL4_9GAMM|nr:hypothetical protein [Halopseudomonas xinjiangensis]HEC46518.1 hypothetical protein [Halopseudomonas xinjiangensis]
MSKPYFQSLRVGGDTLSLTHLEPFTFLVDSNKARKKLRVHVTYSTHCFTRRFYHGSEHPDGYPLLDIDTPRPRIFCPVRYRLSIQLPELIGGLNQPSIKVLQTTSRRNWAYSITILHPAGPYHVFFELSRSAKHQKSWQDLNLVVESAYHEDPNEEPPSFLGTMGFVLLCGKVYLGEPVATKR